MPVTLIGNWGQINRMTKNISSLGATSMRLSLQRWALKAEAVAKGHIISQDFAEGDGWPPLSQYTQERKARLGYGDQTLIETGSYLQSITSRVDKATNTAYATVGGRILTGENAGTDLAEIALIHEYGALEAGIPPRPLWQPTFDEVMAWHLSNNTPRHIFTRLITAQILNRQ